VELTSVKDTTAMTIQDTRTAAAAGAPGRCAACCVPPGWTARFLFGRAARFPADTPVGTPVKRLTGRLMPRRGWPAAGFFAAVAGLLGLAQILAAPAFLVVDAAAFLAAGSWCAVNFWRCRQAHCLVTGPGWLLLAAFTLTEAGLGHSLIGGDEQLVFLSILGVGVILECLWRPAPPAIPGGRSSAGCPGPGPAQDSLPSGSPIR
jgi:hypothetical protein